MTQLDFYKMRIEALEKEIERLKELVKPLEEVETKNPKQ